MKCGSCKEDIQPKFQFAISQNQCPYCGQEIMPEKLKVLLEDLRLILDDAKEFSEEIDEFLAVNHNLHRLDQETLHNLENHKEGTLPNQATEKEISQFAKRAGIKSFSKPKPIKTMSDYKSVINEIQNEPDIDLNATPDEWQEEQEQPVSIKSSQGYDSMPIDISDGSGSNVPIGRQEASTLDNIFGPPNEVLEMEKLRQMRTRLGGNGTPITRKDD